MICKDCGEKDMRYDEKERSYHCNNCGSRNIGTYEEMDKIVVDSFELRNKGNGFESGVLLCFNCRLRGHFCNQCRSQEKCNSDYLANKTKF